VNGKLTQAEVSKTLDFCLNAFQETAPEVREAVLERVDGIDANTKEKGKFEAQLTEEEERVLKSIQAKRMLRTEDILHIDNFSADAIDGFVPNLKRGALGLVKAIQ
jgi:secreted Zn-dependent insulinase-like peptidase